MNCNLNSNQTMYLESNGQKPNIWLLRENRNKITIDQQHEYLNNFRRPLNTNTTNLSILQQL